MVRKSKLDPELLLKAQMEKFNADQSSLKSYLFLLNRIPLSTQFLEVLLIYFYVETFCLGLIGVGTKIDPTLCRGDRLVGHILGAVGTLPDIYTDIEISYYLLRRLLGVRTEANRRGAKVCT